MKKTIFTLALIFITVLICAQETQIPADTATYTYCKLIGMPKGFGVKVAAYVDFGGIQKYINDPVYGWLTMKDGKMATIDSMLGGLNFMASKGWQYVDAYFSSGPGQTEIYLLRKRR